jgi:solute carrier family 39 (zinc transporter), member 9
MCFAAGAHHHMEREVAAKTGLAANAEVAPVAGADHDHHHAEESGSDLHSWIGVALVLGFVFMLLVDQIGGSMHSRSTAGLSSTIQLNS